MCSGSKKIQELSMRLTSHLFPQMLLGAFEAKTVGDLKLFARHGGEDGNTLSPLFSFKTRKEDFSE